MAKNIGRRKNDPTTMGGLIPNKEQRKPPPLRTVALLRIIKNLDLGVGRRAQQFGFGFRIVGGFGET